MEKLAIALVVLSFILTPVLAVWSTETWEYYRFFIAIGIPMAIAGLGVLILALSIQS